MTTKRENEVESCPFCHPDREIIAQNDQALAIADLYPVSLGHSLILPKCTSKRSSICQLSFTSAVSYSCYENLQSSCRSDSIPAMQLVRVSRRNEQPGQC